MEQILRDLGLTEQEARVYVALLDHGECTAVKLASHTNIDRVQIYQITERLIRNGFASFIHKDNVKYFLAADPEKFGRDLEEKQHKFEKVYPLLKLKQESNPPETYVHVLKGMEGFKTLIQMVKDEGEDYCTICGERQSEVVNYKRKQVKTLTSNGQKGRVLQVRGTDCFIGPLEEFRWTKIPKTQMSLVIFGDYVATINWREPMQVIIVKNKDIAVTQKHIFNQLWEQADIPTSEDIAKYTQ